MALARLKLRFPTREKEIKILLDNGIIKENDGIISIFFLDEQLSELESKSKFLSDMGKKGWEVKKAKAELKLPDKPPLKPPLAPPLSNKDKDKDKDKIPPSIKELPKNLVDPLFEKARLLFPGKKRGSDTEWQNLKKKHSDYKELLPLLTEAIRSQMQDRTERQAMDAWVPEWKNFSTWINQRCWEETPGETPSPKNKSKEEMFCP